METCKICQHEFQDDLFNKHIRTHKMTQCSYFQTYFPRFDKFDNSIIRFKNKDYYFNTEFNSRNNLSQWIKASPIKAVEKYIIDVLQYRKKHKGLIFSPCQVELRSLMLPGKKWIEKNIGDFEDFCSSIGLQKRFKQFTGFTKTLALDKRRIIYIDTREKQLVDFHNVKTVIKKLDYGDYCFSNNEWSGRVFIERKSANDFIGTLSGGLDRFEREIIRAKEDGAYLVVLVERKMDDMLDFNNLQDLFCPAKISPEFIFHNVRNLIQKYQNIQFLFIESHEVAGMMIEKLFSLGNVIQQYDLQLLKDSGII